MEKHPDKIKRFFLLLFAWVVAITAIIGGSFIYSAYQDSQYEETAVPYIREVLPQLAQWNVEKTRQLLAPEALKEIAPENLERAMRLFAQLGTLQKMGDPVFNEVFDDDRVPTAPRTLVTYQVPVTFSQGEALFKIQLIDRGDHFQVFNFNLSSETLTKAKP